MSNRVITDPIADGWTDGGTTDNGTPIYSWPGGSSEGGTGGGGDSLWTTEGDSVVYRSSDESGVYIYDTRAAGIFNRAQLYMLNEVENAGGWLGAQSDAFQIGFATGVDPEVDGAGVRSPVMTIHSNGQCSIGSWQLPPSDEKFYCNGTAKFTNNVTASSFTTVNGSYNGKIEALSSGQLMISSGFTSGGRAHPIVFEISGDEAFRIAPNKSATFKGNVDATGFTINGVPIGGGGGLPDGGYTYGYQFAAATSVITCVNGNLSNGIKAEASAGSSYRNTLAHTDYGLEFQSNSSSRAWKFTNGGGDRVVISTGGNVTAADFIATSDERAKDNITTAPVGLIDSPKGREWDWKESGEKGSGVVAQELEKVLPHLVHTDDEGMKSVSYNGLVAYLIEELKDCRQRIAELEAKA